MSHPRDYDGLNAFRGILIGCGISLPLWGILYLILTF